MAQVGRPSKLNKDVQERICAAIRTGCTYKLAAQCGGIDAETMRRWMNSQEPEYVAFAEAIKKAEAENAQSLLALIQGHAVTQWQAGAWILERRHPDEFARKSVLQVDPNAAETFAGWKSKKDKTDD